MQVSALGAVGPVVIGNTVDGVEPFGAGAACQYAVAVAAEAADHVIAGRAGEAIGVTAARDRAAAGIAHCRGRGVGVVGGCEVGLDGVDDGGVGERASGRGLDSHGHRGLVLATGVPSVQSALVGVVVQ